MPACELSGLSFQERLCAEGLYPLRAGAVEILQINLGRQCNLSCRHCHLQAGSDRTEQMSRPILEACLAAAAKTPALTTFDLTGGAPEMNPHLEWFLEELARQHRRILVRTNLVILLEPDYEKYFELYARHRVEVVGSLPAFHSDQNDRQRGAGSFGRAVQALRRLNDLGYGVQGSALILNLMHNPVGAYLPGSQQALAEAYHHFLQEQAQVRFNRLYCLNNMPLGRFAEFLEHSGNAAPYRQTLRSQFARQNVSQAMCRNTVSVQWDGQLYDCDFNQAAQLAPLDPANRELGQWDAAKLAQREIAIADHCFGCTAGAGSSCQGCFDA